MATVDEYITALETEFRTELDHLATQVDLKSLEMRMAGMMSTVGALIVGILKLWQ